MNTLEAYEEREAMKEEQNVAPDMSNTMLFRAYRIGVITVILLATACLVTMILCGR